LETARHLLHLVDYGSTYEDEVGDQVPLYLFYAYISHSDILDAVHPSLSLARRSLYTHPFAG
jgi:hypothetical protein